MQRWKIEGEIARNKTTHVHENLQGNSNGGSMFCSAYVLLMLGQFRQKSEETELQLRMVRRHRDGGQHGGGSEKTRKARGVRSRGQ